MKVSVIIPNYNHGKFLKQRIDTILCQTYQDFELIILDDCSTDESRSIIDEYVAKTPGTLSFYNNSNSGNPFKQWDFGVSKANGEFIWIAESDDFADPSFLEKTSSILIKNENVGLVYCNSKVIDLLNNTEYFISDLKVKSFGKKWKDDYINSGKNEISECLFRQNTINNVSGVLFRKSKYVEAGYADQSMKYCGDWFLYIRILLNSDIAYIANPLNTYRLHAGSSLHQYYRKSSFLSEVLRVYLFIIPNINLPVKKKISMARFFLANICRQLIHGHIPELNEIIKILIRNKR
jgi:glycosyltransferase involved in cell wall biosynthesis